MSSNVVWFSDIGLADLEQGRESAGVTGRGRGIGGWFGGGHWVSYISDRGAVGSNMRVGITTYGNIARIRATVAIHVR